MKLPEKKRADIEAAAAMKRAEIEAAIARTRANAAPGKFPIAIYVRASGDSQAKAGTPEQQIAKGFAFAMRERYPVYDVYQDGDAETGGRSATAGAGKLEARTELHRMIGDMQASRFGGVWVHDQDRVTRDEDLIRRYFIIGSMQRARCVLMEGNGAIHDLNTVQGQIMVSIGTTMAADEGRKIQERTQRGKRALVDRGGLPHGRPPYGFRYDRKTGWSVEESEASVIRECIERIGNGEPCARIALDLEARGVPCPGKRWQGTSVRTLLEFAEARYLGRWRANKVTGAWVTVPAILAMDAVERARTASIANRRVTRGGPVRRRHYFFDRKFARCACGGWIGIRSTSNDSKQTYVCRSQLEVKGSRHRCGARGILVTSVEAPAWDAVYGEVMRPALVKSALQALAQSGTATERAAREALDKAHARLADADAKAAAIAERVASLPADAVVALLDKIAVERKAAAAAVKVAKEALAGMEGGAMDPGAVEEALASLRKRAETATPEERRAIVRAVLVEPVLSGRTLTARIALPMLGGDPVYGDCSTSVNRITIGTLRIDIRKGQRVPPTRGAGGRFGAAGAAGR